MKTAPYWFPLFRLMHEQHGLTLLDGELNEIALAVDECRSTSESNTPDFRKLLDDERSEIMRRMLKHSKGRRQKWKSKN